MSEWQRLRMPTTTRRRGRLLRHEQSREATTRGQSNNGPGSSPHASGASQATALRLPTGTFRVGLQRCLTPYRGARALTLKPLSAPRARLCRAHAASTHTTRSATWPLMRYSLGPASGCFRAERQPPTDFILPCPRLVCCHLRAIGALRCLRSTSRRCLPPQSLSRLLARCPPRTLLTGWWRATVRYTLLGESTSLHGAAVVESLWDGTRNTSRRDGELFRLRLTLPPAGHTPLHAVRTRAVQGRHTGEWNRQGSCSTCSRLR